MKIKKAVLYMILLGFVVLLVIGGGYWYWRRNNVVETEYPFFSKIISTIGEEAIQYGYFQPVVTGFHTEDETDNYIDAQYSMGNQNYKISILVTYDTKLSESRFKSYFQEDSPFPEKISYMAVQGDEITSTFVTFEQLQQLISVGDQIRVKYISYSGYSKEKTELAQCLARGISDRSCLSLYYENYFGRESDFIITVDDFPEITNISGNEVSLELYAQ